MARMLCWSTTCCLPGAAAPPLRADCFNDDVNGYEELPASMPPHVPRGLTRDDDAGGVATFAEEQVVAPAPDGGGVGAGSWLALVCVSVYGKVAGPIRS